VTSSASRRWWTSTRPTRPQHRPQQISAASPEPRLPGARATCSRRAGASASNRFIGNQPSRRSRQREPVDDHIDGVDFTTRCSQWRARVQPGGHQRVRVIGTVRHGDRWVGRGRCPRHEVGHEQPARLRLRLLPRRLAAREGRAGSEEGRFTRGSSSAAPSAARSRRTKCILRVVEQVSREQLRALRPSGRTRRRRPTSRCRSTSRCRYAGSTRGCATTRTCASSCL